MWVAVAVAAVGLMAYGASQQRQGAKAAKSAAEALRADAKEAYERGKMSDEEVTQYQDSFDIGKTVEQVQKYQMGLGSAPEGYASGKDQYIRQTGEIGQKLYDTALADNNDPYATYESQLQPALQAAEDFVNTSMQKRGLLQSGLSIENMGRAGVDLAIQEAQQRMAYRADALTRAASMSDAVQGTQSENLINLSNTYNQRQSYGLSAAGRQAGQAINIMPYQTAGSQAKLGYGYGQRAAGSQNISGGMSMIGTAGIGAMGGSPVNPPVNPPVSSPSSQPYYNPPANNLNDFRLSGSVQ